MPGLSKVIVLDPDVRAGRQIQLGFQREGVPAEVAEVPRDTAQLALPGEEPGLVVVGGTDGPGLELVRQTRRVLDDGGFDAPIVFAGRGVRRTDAEAAGADEVVLAPAYLRDIVTIGRLLRGQPSTHRAHLVGSLAETTGVLTLVRAFSALGRSAMLTLIRGLRRGEIRFYHGEVTSAHVGMIHGQAALHQLLLWTDARFDFHHEDIVRRHQIPLERDELFADAERFLAGVRDSSGKLSPSMVLEQDIQRLQSLGRQIPTEVYGVLRMFDGHRVLADVLEDSPYRVFETLRVTQLAVEAGLLRQTATQRPRATWRAVLALEEWLVGAETRDEVLERNAGGDSGAVPSAAADPADDRTGKVKGSKKKRKKQRTPVAAAAAGKPEINWGSLVPRIIGAEVGPLAGVVPASHASGEITTPPRDEPREKLEALDTGQRGRLFPMEGRAEPSVVWDEAAELARIERDRAEAAEAAKVEAEARAERERAEAAAKAEAEAAEAEAAEAAARAERERAEAAAKPEEVAAKPEAAAGSDEEARAERERAEAAAKAEADTRAEREAAAKAEEATAKAEADARAEREAAEAAAKAEEEARAEREAAAKAEEMAAKAEADARAEREAAEAAAKAEADARAEAERAQAAAKAEADARAEAERAQAAAKAEADARAEAERAEAAAKAEADARAEAERAEVAAKAEADARAEREAAELASRLAAAAPAAPASETADERARRDVEETAQLEAMYRAEAEAEAAAKAEAEAAAAEAVAVAATAEETTRIRRRAAVFPAVESSGEPVSAMDLVKQLALDQDTRVYAPGAPTEPMAAVVPMESGPIAVEPVAAETAPPAVAPETAPPVAAEYVRDTAPIVTSERAPTASGELRAVRSATSREIDDESERPTAPMAAARPATSELPRVILEIPPQELDRSAAPSETSDEPSDGIIRQTIASAETVPSNRRLPTSIPIDDRPEDATGEIVSITGQQAAVEPPEVGEPSILVADLAAVHTAVSAVAVAQTGATPTLSIATPAHAQTVAAVRADATTTFSDVEEDFFRAGHEKPVRPPSHNESFEDLDEGYRPVGFWDRLLGRKPKR